jgi:hypothetical protein
LCPKRQVESPVSITSSSTLSLLQGLSDVLERRELATQRHTKAYQAFSSTLIPCDHESPCLVRTGGDKPCKGAVSKGAGAVSKGAGAVSSGPTRTVPVRNPSSVTSSTTVVMLSLSPRPASVVLTDTLHRFDRFFLLHEDRHPAQSMVPLLLSTQISRAAAAVGLQLATCDET